MAKKEGLTMEEAREELLKRCKTLAADCCEANMQGWFELEVATRLFVDLNDPILDDLEDDTGALG